MIIHRLLTRAAFLSFMVLTLVLFPNAASAIDVTVDCTGATPSAYTSLQAAIDSLDFVGPHTIHIVQGPCVENVWIVDHQRLTIQGEGSTITLDGSSNGPTMGIYGSTAIHLLSLAITDGTPGLIMDRASEVTIENSSVTGSSQGIAVGGNSTLTISSLSVSGNARNGITVVDSELSSAGPATIENNGNYGLVFRKGRGALGELTIQNNRSGLGVNASSVEVYAPFLLQNNTVGLNVINGGSVALYGDSQNPVTITGNTWVGINTYSGSVLLGDGVHVTNNGSGMQDLRAGIRVDDNTTLVTAGTIEVSGNYGPGIDSVNGGVIDLSNTTISNNRGDGIRVIGGATVLMYPPNSNVFTGNAGINLNCDGTSTLVGDKTGLGQLSCKFSPLSGYTGKAHKAMLAGEE